MAELLTIFNQLVEDVANAWGIDLGNVIEEDMLTPQTALPYALVSLMPMELVPETPVTESGTLQMAIIGRWSYTSLGVGESPTRFKIQKFEAIREKLTTSAGYASVGYSPYVAALDINKQDEIEERTLYVSILFMCGVSLQRG